MGTVTIRPAAAIAFSLLLTLVAPAAFAQGLVSGRVRAPDGTPIEGATIVAQNLQSGRALNGETDGNGRFAFIGLSRGQWAFSVEKFGYEPSQGVANITRTRRTNISFTLEVNPFAPPIPTSGVLAGLHAGEIQEDLTAAHSLFDRGEFDEAIDAYEVLLERVPTLTSLNLQIGHAYLEKRDYERARAAYQAVPADTPAAAEATAAIEALERASTGR